MTPKEQLKALLRIQELALEIRDTQSILENAPGKIEEIEQRFRERNAEYVAVRDRYDALETDRRQRSGELEILGESHKKLMEDLMAVKNQREYAAILKEIDTVKGQIAENEDAVLTDMEEIEKLKEELATHEEHINSEREQVAKERVEVQAAEKAARENIHKLTAKRAECERGLPDDVRNAVGRLEQSRRGVFLARIENGTCLSCFVRVRPQVFQEVKQAAALHNCGQCKRFLYYEAALRPKPAAPTSDVADSGSVNAVNGGAV